MKEFARQGILSGVTLDRSIPPTAPMVASPSGFFKRRTSFSTKAKHNSVHPISLEIVRLLVAEFVSIPIVPHVHPAAGDILEEKLQ